MQRVMQALRAEHHRLARLLNVLDQQAEALVNVRYVDFDLTRRIAVYCDEYVSALHHPMEELLIARLVARAPASLIIVEPLLEQHCLLANDTDSLLRTTEQLLTDAPMVRSELAEKLRRFVRHNAEHREYEEREVFPLVERTLNQADWDFLARFRRLEKRFDEARPAHHGHHMLEQIMRDNA